MGTNEFAGRIVEFTFGWVKVIADGLWGLFSGTGSSGGGFIRWIGNHWMLLLAVLLIGGVVIDWLVWMLRWQPYKLWFRLKRRVYDERELDENYAAPQENVQPSARPKYARKPASDPLFDIPDGKPSGGDLFDMDTADDPYAEKSAADDDLFAVAESPRHVKKNDDNEWFDDRK